MLLDLDIYRVARALVHAHGDEAPVHGTRRADAALQTGDVRGWADWLEIMTAAEMNRLFLFAFFLQAAVGARGELLLELVDSTGGIHKLQFPRVKRVAGVADINFQFATADAAGFKRIAATA